MHIETSRLRDNLKAVLGPTNTGKTHLAMERMLAHASGMIGFPLRLLARENYDRAVKIKGRGQVALITGEEKILPKGARYFLCTVESMPTDRPLDFVGIDEIQLCADPERGHIFTQRLLHARGLKETMFMGADTMRPALGALLDDISFISRPRFSALGYAGRKKITRLAPRSAVVTFSLADVYALGEMMRRHRGGAALVMGALSPRTRNAQVEMFQSGEVDYLIATDAVGMGLNMDVDHVALAATGKFDGRIRRRLSVAELAQIAGRAGRHMNDGTFGTTMAADRLSAEEVEQIENHNFAPVRTLFWRNAALRFSSLDALLHSLRDVPDRPGLVRAREAHDERALITLAKDAVLRDIAHTPAAVHLLWDVCRIPDFQKIMSDAHAQLLGQLFRHLAGPAGRLPGSWMNERVARLDRLDGDIDTLLGRISQIRTWTYVSHQTGWLDDPIGWQERTRSIENNLSDTLHERLTQRFVDRRSAVLMRPMTDQDHIDTHIADDGAVEVEGHFIGHLRGFRFTADANEHDGAARALDHAATRILRARVKERVSALTLDDDAQFSFTPQGRILWRGDAVGAVKAGPAALKPQAFALTSDLLDSPEREKIRTRLALWLETTLNTRMKPLLTALDSDLKGPARGLVFQLAEQLGSLDREGVEEQIKAIEREERREMRRLGVRLGRQMVYMPELLKPAAMEMRLMLWAVRESLLSPPPPPPPGRVSVPFDRAQPRGYYDAVGFRRAGPLALRIDMLERICELSWSLLRDGDGAFSLSADLMSLAGCGPEEMDAILHDIGFVAIEDKYTLKHLRHKVRKALKAAAEASTTQNDDATQAPDVMTAPVPDGTMPTPASGDTGTPASEQGEQKPSASPAPPGDGAQTPPPSADGKTAHKKKPGGRSKVKKSRKGAPHPASRRDEQAKPTVDPDSPFAKLLELKLKK
ncbi:helicase-related protein [Varunaivibrio sulfuroxidans]|uniref:ATP-dependent RNA helicase SUPV3L1/SUV3 n=1 Tax=Varunaivibrio sulfuroxidans TaxID=1773489 RepID=A0A4R3JCI1_9PROT|nr:helicase-related protein [Varunaivibrio sulfuroxidans]TCS63658.1 ATP-dependent RNA helicase SUPV3L1/SUV3 [Varunaivibrio sulfuroxidans]WES30204.1 helicase-related protein [Varunaivibrio sulfuroxidans]